MQTLYELGKLLDIRVDSNLPIQSYHIHSREVEKGSLFFAIKGEKADGHNFLEEVASLGGYGAVVSNTYKGPAFGLVLIRVSDVKEALQTLARKILAKRKTKVIGITGSVGKTTTKDFLFDLLSVKFRVEKNPRSFNSQITLPLVVLRAKEDLDYLILEMSMSSKGHIAKLVQVASPSYAIITPIGLVHAAFFDSLEDIAHAKSEILAPSVEFAVIHETAIKFNAICEALHSEHTVYGAHTSNLCPFSYTHFRENFAGAYEMARHLGMSDQEIARGIKKMKASEHRFQIKTYQGITFVDASYNANPVSARAVISNLPKAEEGGKKVAVFGSMGELGKFSFMSHLEVARIALKHIDHLLLIGKECKPMVDVFQKEGRPVELFDSYDKLANRMREISKKGDVVLVKGSNSHELWKVIAFID